MIHRKTESDIEYITDYLYYFCPDCGSIHHIPGKCEKEGKCKGTRLEEGGWGYIDMLCSNEECNQKYIVTSSILNDATFNSNFLCVTCKHGKLYKPSVESEVGWHFKIGSSWDGKDRGKVIKEKNEQLKKKWAGMEGEQKNLREELTAKAQKRISEAGLG